MVGRKEQTTSSAHNFEAYWGSSHAILRMTGVLRLLFGAAQSRPLEVSCLRVRANPESRLALEILRVGLILFNSPCLNS